MFPGIVSRHRNLHGAMRRPRCAVASGNGRFPYTRTAGGPAKIAASANGHTNPNPEPVTQICVIPAGNSVPNVDDLSDVLMPGRQGVFLPRYSSTAGASGTASLAFCSSESGGAKRAS
jgi:hypothetical protein